MNYNIQYPKQKTGGSDGDRDEEEDPDGDVDHQIHHPNYQLHQIQHAKYFKPSQLPNIKVVQLVLVMKRKIQTEMLTTYLPTILLLGIPYATTFFKPMYFEAVSFLNAYLSVCVPL